MDGYVPDPYRSLPVIDDDFTPMWRVYLFTPGEFQELADAEAVEANATRDPQTGQAYTTLTEIRRANVALASWNAFVTSVEISSSTTQHRHSEATITLESEDGALLDDPTLIEGLFVRLDIGYSNTNAGPNFGPAFIGKIARVEPEFSKGVTISVVCQPVEVDYTNHQVRYDMPVGVTSGTVAKYLADYMGMAISMPFETPEAPAGYNFGIGSPIFLLYRLASAVGFRFWVDNYIVYFVNEADTLDGPTTALFSFRGHERNVWSAQISYDPMVANTQHQFGNVDSETGEVVLETSGVEAAPDLNAQQPTSENQIIEDRSTIFGREQILLGDAQRPPSDGRLSLDVLPPQYRDALGQSQTRPDVVYKTPRGFLDVQFDENGMRWNQTPTADQTPKHLWKTVVELEHLPRNKDEAKRLADAVASVKKFPHVMMLEAVGAWVIRPGDKVTVRGLCQRFDGDWLVDEITHKCTGRSFRSLIKARRNLLYTPKHSGLSARFPERSWEDLQKEANASYARNVAVRKSQEALSVVKGRAAELEKFLVEQGARIDLSQRPENQQSDGANTHNTFVDELHKRLGLKAEEMPEGYTLYRPAVGSYVTIPGISLPFEALPRGGRSPVRADGSVVYTSSNADDAIRELNDIEALSGYISAETLRVRPNELIWAPQSYDPANPALKSPQHGFLVVCFTQPLDRIGTTKVSGTSESYWLIHERDMPTFRRLAADMHRDTLELEKWEAELEEQS